MTHTVLWEDASVILVTNVAMSAAAFLVTWQIIPKFRDMFINNGFYGLDMSKREKVKIPESTGVIGGAIFLCVMFLFIPVPFHRHFGENEGPFPHNVFVEFITALLSICCMIFLGFADDALDLKWRHKLMLPTLATLPLLMVYYVNFNSTVIIVPRPFRPYFGHDVDLHVLYYVYMGMLAVFCTNAINILAGINGIEVGQAIVIALSIIIFNFSELSGDFRDAHLFSLYFLLPYVAVTLALLYYNWYPSRVFIGDTFCYFSGMTFAVVGILGHFSKTMMLFFIPQAANFVYSVPQLFRLLPCPRHRLPRYLPDENKLTFSTMKVKSTDINVLGQFILNVAQLLRVVYIKKEIRDDAEYTEFSNLTIINLALIWFGPTHERTLVIYLLVLQVFCSGMAFFVRYPLAIILRRLTSSHLSAPGHYVCCDYSKNYLFVKWLGISGVLNRNLLF